jgi:hypothetical protein
MNTWDEVMKEIQSEKVQIPDGRIVPDTDNVRRKKMKEISEYTKRPLIVYAVDFLNHRKAQAAGPGIGLDEGDKEGFNEVTENIKSDKVDVLIHSPGGRAEAVQSFVEILRSRFKSVRFIVPNIAKSAATMLVLSGDEILLNSVSELGPIDPQFTIPKGDGSRIMAPAQTIIDQFEKAQENISKNPKLLVPWLPILQQYGPSLYQEAQNAIALSKELVEQWLAKYMFRDDREKSAKAKSIAGYLGDHNNFKSHAKRIGLQDITSIDALRHLKIVNMEEDKELNNKIWGLYHAITITFGMTAAFKIFENTEGRALIISLQIIEMPVQMPPKG